MVILILRDRRENLNPTLLKTQNPNKRNNKMNKKDEQKKAFRILSYIFLVIGPLILIKEIFFSNIGNDDLPQWFMLLLGVICMFCGIMLYKNSRKSSREL